MVESRYSEQGKAPDCDEYLIFSAYFRQTEGQQQGCGL